MQRDIYGNSATHRIFLRAVAGVSVSDIAKFSVSNILQESIALYTSDETLGAIHVHGVYSPPTSTSVSGSGFSGSFFLLQISSKKI